MQDQNWHYCKLSCYKAKALDYHPVYSKLANNAVLSIVEAEDSEKSKRVRNAQKGKIAY